MPTLVWSRKPTAKPTASMSVTTRTLRQRSAIVRPASTAERAIGRERRRSMRPLPRSSASPTAVCTAPKATTWAKIAGHQVVDVVDARNVDGAAEHVAEHQDEQQRLDRGEHEELRHPPDREQVAPGHRQDVAHAEAHASQPAQGEGKRSRDGGGRHAHDLLLAAARVGGLVGRFGLGAARRPVRARNTSSREGSRTAAAAGSMPSASRARTAAISACVPSFTFTRSVRPSRATRAELRGGRGCPPPAAPGVVQDGQLEHGAAETALQLGGRALGEGAAAVDHHDAVGQQVGLLEVLGGEQHGGAAGHEAAHGLPEVVAAGRVEARGGLVEDRAREAGGRGRPPGPGAAACHRSRCGRGGPRPPRARTARAARPPAGRSHGAAGG